MRASVSVSETQTCAHSHTNGHLEEFTAELHGLLVTMLSQLQEGFHLVGFLL